MKVLVTGGAGFIGSHLTEALLGRRNSVCVIDDLSTGRLKNIKDLKNNKSFRFVKGSILDRGLMKKLVGNADIIFHLAAAVGVKNIMENRINTLCSNVKGTEILLDLVSSGRKKRKVILASTSEIYGKNGQVPYKEDADRLLGPPTLYRWSYSCSKAFDEFLALAYFYEKKLPIVIMRLFNTVGPRQLGQYGMVVPRFVQAALANKDIVIYGDGKQTRCFTYIDDVVAAMMKLSKSQNAIGEVFNVGSDNEISINDLAKKIITLSKSKSRIKYISYQEAYGLGFEDMKRRVPDISKIKKFINWQPEVKIDQIISRLVASHS